MSVYKILIVEDDPDFGHLLKQYLELNGFKSLRVFNGKEAIEELKINEYDLLIVDVMMPEDDGFALANKLNTHFPEIPFLFVTAKKMKEDILQGLKLGAVDYIVKPFDADELILRIKNILRRVKRVEAQVVSIVSIGAYTFDYSNLQLSLNGDVKILTEKEAQLLLYLYNHQHELIKRKDILTYLWKEPDFFNGRSMDVFVSRVRKLLSGDPSIHIDSVRGVGFRFYITGDN